MRKGGLNRRLGKIITRVMGKPGSLGFRLAWDTAGVMVERFAMTSIEGQKEGAVIMENGHAEMHAQRSVLSLVTRLGGPWVEAGTPRMKI